MVRHFKIGPTVPKLGLHEVSKAKSLKISLKVVFHEQLMVPLRQASRATPKNGLTSLKTPKFRGVRPYILLTSFVRLGRVTSRTFFGHNYLKEGPNQKTEGTFISRPHRREPISIKKTWYRRHFF